MPSIDKDDKEISLGPKTRIKLPIKTQVELHKADLESNEKKNRMTHEYGWISRFFGINEKNVALYIVATISAMLITFSALYTIFWLFLPQDNFVPKELWTIIIPVITAMLGYVFGSNSNNKDSEE